ncbi:MAG TPA: hypothetical protein VMV86_05760, partial [Methanosarcinales archaeon]|nr:hypothetical protein [Methanosarcinales archaeon]
MPDQIPDREKEIEQVVLDSLPPISKGNSPSVFLNMYQALLNGSLGYWELFVKEKKICSITISIF